MIGQRRKRNIHSPTLDSSQPAAVARHQHNERHGLRASRAALPNDSDVRRSASARRTGSIEGRRLRSRLGDDHGEANGRRCGCHDVVLVMSVLTVPSARPRDAQAAVAAVDSTRKG